MGLKSNEFLCEIHTVEIVKIGTDQNDQVSNLPVCNRLEGIVTYLQTKINTVYNKKAGVTHEVYAFSKLIQNIKLLRD